jgi:zeta-carotene desaturase
MYDPILVGSLNEDPRHASCSYAIQVFQDALLFNAAGYVLGLPNCPLAQLYNRFPCPDVRLGTRVSEIVFDAKTAKGVKVHSGEFLPADAVVLATNHHAVQRWIPDDLQATDSRFAGLAKLESVPILGAHLWFDRPVLHEPHAAFIEGPLQWLFRKDLEGRVVHGVISAARDWLDIPRDDALRQFQQQIRATFPQAQDAKLERGVIVIEKRATFSPLPGSDSLRPAQGPDERGIRNLYLAGDYTRTGWPATMEGAVRSGYLAAEAVAKNLAATNGRRFLIDDLPQQWPAKLMERL